MEMLAFIFIGLTVGLAAVFLAIFVIKKLISWAFAAIGFLFQAILWIVSLPFVWIGKALFGGAR